MERLKEFFEELDRRGDKSGNKSQSLIKWLGRIEKKKVCTRYKYRLIEFLIEMQQRT